MDPNAPVPNALAELSPEVRRFLMGVRDSEIPNLELLANLDKDEREKLDFVIKRFTLQDLEVINESLENLRTMKRFGRFGMWVMGAIIAGASVAAVLKTLFVPGGSK